MAKKISVLVVEPGTSPRLTQTEDTMKAFEKIVGGPVEIGYMPSLRVMLFYNGAENSRGLTNGARRRCTAWPEHICCVDTGTTAIHPFRPVRKSYSDAGSLKKHIAGRFLI